MSLQNIKTVSIPSIGKLSLADKGNTFTPAAKKREHKAGRLAEDGGFHETSVPAKLELALNLGAGMNVEALNNIVDEDVTIRLSDGKVYLMPMAFSSDASSVSDSDSKLVLMSNTSELISS